MGRTAVKAPVVALAQHPLGQDLAESTYTSDLIDSAHHEGRYEQHANAD